MGRTAVFGVVFPGVKDYIDAYLESLESQTVSEFDLVFINDGFEEIFDVVRRYGLNVKILDHTGTPAKIREIGIRNMIEEGYEHIIFTDCDDVCSKKRVEKSLELLKEYDVVVNDLTLISDDGMIIDEGCISKRINNMSPVDAAYISDKNVFGFTNTSVNARCIDKDICFPEDLVAVDWYLFGKLLKKGYKAVFTNEIETYYRIYSGNTAGLSDTLDADRIKKGINVKLVHYRELARDIDEYKGLYNSLKGLNEKMQQDDFIDRYMSKIRSLDLKNVLWWESIKIPEELGL